jgi:hypothetical protein
MTELLRVTLDEHRAVVHVDIPRLDDQLRDATVLVAAFDAAYADSVAATLPEPLPGRVELARRPAPRPHPPLRDLVQQALDGRRPMVRPSAPPRREHRGLSRNTCIEVTLSPAGNGGSLQIDQGWLSNAEPRNVADAIAQAFADAYENRSSR